MMPQDPTRICYTNSISGVAINIVIPSSGLQKFVRSLSKQAPALVPALFRIVSTSAYLQNPGAFWTSCLHAKELALLMLSDAACQPSSEAIALLDAMRSQGVDWLAWLSVQPDSDRNGAQELDEGDVEEGEDPAANDRVANLSERRELLRTDSDAFRRATQSLQIQSGHGEHMDAVHRFLHWLEHDSDASSSLNGGDATNSPGRQPESSSGTFSSLHGIGAQTSPGQQPDFSHSDEPAASPIRAQACPQAPPNIPWQREPLLECDLAWSRLPPDLYERERHRPPLLTDEACRLIRSTDSFGALLVGLRPQAPLPTLRFIGPMLRPKPDSLLHK